MATMAVLPLANAYNTKDLKKDPMGIERVAQKAHPKAYTTGAKSSPDHEVSLIIDLGHPQKIDAVKIFPVIGDGWDAYWYEQFPVRFKIDAADDFEFSEPQLISDQTKQDYEIKNFAKIESFSPEKPVTARFVRITFTKLKKYSDNIYSVDLYKVNVMSDGKNIAENRPLFDSDQGYLGKHPLLRPDRPEGEGVVKDHPENVTDPKTWNAPEEKASVMRKGIVVGDKSLFKTALERNAEYLKNSFTVDDMLIEFRRRAGKPHGTNSRGLDNPWVNILPGSAAGRFLMGAGNQVRWENDPELRKRIDQIVDGIDECKAPNGWIMGYPEDEVFYFENGAYCRAWLTHGLIEAGFAGNKKAFPMLRKFYDYFDASPYPRELMRRGGQGRQGVIGYTRMYHTPVGKPIDIQTMQRHYQENFWMDQLADRNVDAVWLYPYDRAHSYLLVSMDAFMDVYKATGDQKYLDASLGAWDIFHDYFQNVGGAITICELHPHPPKSNWLNANANELCGSVFWMFFNQRLHTLYPEEEKYADEIEKSIYNCLLPAQDEKGAIRYHSKLVDHKEGPQDTNTCCEGQGTRAYGALPEFIYTKAKDGVYVNLFNESKVEWEQNGKKFGMEMRTDFPYRPSVKLVMTESGKSNIRIRIPQWADKKMNILVNDKKAAVGKPGTYVSIDRDWKKGDTISFTLPMSLKTVKYEGMEPDYNNPDNHTHAVMYGPVLMAITGDTLGDNGKIRLDFPASEIKKRLKAEKGKPLTFTVDGMDGVKFEPYFEIQDGKMNCFQFYKAD